MVEPLHVLLKVLPEGQERLLHFTLELLKTETTNKTDQQKITKGPFLLNVLTEDPPPELFKPM